MSVRVRAGRIAAVRQWIADRPDAVLHLAPTAIIDRHDSRLGTWRCPLADMHGPIDRVPDLCVEILSNNRTYDRLTKRQRQRRGRIKESRRANDAHRHR